MSDTAIPHRTCGQCRHWHPMPLPPGPRDLSQPRQGQCRESPPQVTLLPAPQGQLSLVNYPPLPQDYPCCSRFLQQLAVIEEK